MAGFYGADTEQLRGFGDQLQGGRSRLEELAGELASGIYSVEWIGSDADSFRDDFSGRVTGLFDTAGGLLDRFRNEAGDHAEEQDEASADDDGGILGAIGDVVGDIVDGAVDFVTGLGEGVWDFLNHPLMTGGFELLGHGLSLVEDAMTVVDDLGNIVKNPPAWLGVAGKVLGGVSIITGVNQMLNPTHDGWRGVGDRIAGGLSVVAGVAAFVPGGQVVAAVAGGAAALWNAGNWVADNWDGITETAGNVADTVGDAAGATADFIGDAAGGVADFVGGLF